MELEHMEHFKKKQINIFLILKFSVDEETKLLVNGVFIEFLVQDISLKNFFVE